MDEGNELVARLCTAAGMIMEDTSPMALRALPTGSDEMSTRLAELEDAGRDATVLIHAAQVLARRNIR